ncbi:MAG: hypothetical protein QXU14_07065 [Metallosphaera sp.]
MIKYSLSLISFSFVLFLLMERLNLPLALAALSSLSFWTGLGILVFKKVGWGRGKVYYLTLVIYLLYHSFLYSFVLGILEPGGLKQASDQVIGSGFGFEVPTPPVYFPLWVSQAFAFWVIFKGYEAVVVPFTLFIGAVLGNLLGLNVRAIFKLYNVTETKAARSIITLPALGIVSGASCCLALPSIVLYSVALSFPILSPSILALLSSSTYFSLVYYGLPIISSVALYLNLRVLSKATRACELGKSAFKSTLS